MDPLQHRAQRSIHAVEELDLDNHPDVSAQFFKPLQTLRGAAIGNASIFTVARREIATKAESRRLIAENETLSTRLKGTVDLLVSRSRNEINNAGIDARRVQSLGREVLLSVAGLSLASSFLIVWLYVGRNIVARLTRLSQNYCLSRGRRITGELPGHGGARKPAHHEALRSHRR